MTDTSKKAIEKAARAGGAIVRKYFGRVLAVEEKATSADFRTQADVQSEAAILAILEKAFPAYNIFSEECGFVDKKSEYTFYVDPLDGTNNFVLGLPNFSVLIALVRGHETLFGAVYLPMLDLFYFAEKGKGAFCGKTVLKPSSEKSLARATVGYACGYKTAKEEVVRVISAIKIKGQASRTLFNWSPAVDFCLLASGKIESVINDKTQLYDFLAPKIIAKEAGCIVTDWKGKPEKDDFNSMFVVSNTPAIQKQIISIL